MADAPKQNLTATEIDVSCPENMNYFSSGESNHPLSAREAPVNARGAFE